MLTSSFPKSHFLLGAHFISHILIDFFVKCANSILHSMVLPKAEMCLQHLYCCYLIQINPCVSPLLSQSTMMFSEYLCGIIIKENKTQT